MANYEDMSIDELLQAAKSDPEARRALIKRVVDKLEIITRGARRKYPGVVALDVTADDLQSALLSVFKRLDGQGYESEKHFFCSFKQSVIHVLIGKLRKLHMPTATKTPAEDGKTKLKRQVRLATNDIAGTKAIDDRNEPGPSTIVMNNERAELLYECVVEVLAPDELSLFWEIKIECRPQVEVFKRMGVKYSTGQERLKGITKKIKEEAVRRKLG